MKKSLLAAAFAAAFLASGGAAYAGLDGTWNGTTDGDNKNGVYTVDTGETLVVDSAVAKLINNGDTSSSVTMDDTGVLQIASGSNVLTVTGGDGSVGQAGTASIVLTNSGVLDISAGSLVLSNSNSILDLSVAVTGNLTIAAGSITNNGLVKGNAADLAALGKITKGVVGTGGSVGELEISGRTAGAIDFTSETDYGKITGGNLILKADDNGTNSNVNAGKATLTIDTTAVLGDDSTTYSGKDIDVQKAGAITSTLTATGADGLNSGTVQLNAAADLQGTVNAGLLDVQETAGSSANFTYSGDLNIEDTKTFTNTAVGTDTVNDVDVPKFDLSGHNLTGKGTLINTGSVGIKGADTNIGDNFKITNAAGEIFTDADAMKSTFSKDDGTFRNGLFTADNIGRLSVNGNVAIDGIDWSSTTTGVKGGKITLDDASVAAALAGEIATFGVDGGTVNLGLANLEMRNTVNNVLKGTIKANELTVTRSGDNESDFTGSVNVAGGQTLTNKTPNGKITVDKNPDDSKHTLTVNGTLVNETEIIVTENANAIAGGGAIENFYGDAGEVKAGQITVDGANVGNLATLLAGQQDNDTKENIGSINIKNQLAGGFNVGTAEVGDLTFDDAQDIGMGVVDVGTANVTFEDDGNVIDDNVTGGKVTFNGDGDTISSVITGETVEINGDLGDYTNSTFNAGDMTITGNGGLYDGSTLNTGKLVIAGEDNDLSQAEIRATDDVIVKDKNATIGQTTITFGDFIVEEGATGATLTGSIQANYTAGPPAKGGNIILNEAVTANVGAAILANGGNVTIKRGGTYAENVTALAAPGDTSKATGKVSIEDGTYAKAITGTNKVNFTSTGYNNLTVNGLVTSLNDNVTIDGDGRFLGGITTADGFTTTLKKNRKAGFAGPLNTDFNIESDATFRLSGDVDVQKTLTGNYNSTIEFGANILNGLNKFTATTGTIDLKFDPNAPCGGTKLRVDPTAPLTDGAAYYVFDQSALDALVLNSNVNTTDATIDAYLDRQSFVTIAGSGTFDRLADGITYTGTAVDFTDNADIINHWNAAMKQTGLYDKMDMLDEGTIGAMYDYAGLTEADFATGGQYADLTDQQQYYIKLMSGLAGNTVFNDLRCALPGEAAATAQWATGQDLAGSLEAVSDTVRSFGRNISKHAQNSSRILGYDFDDCGNPIDCFNRPNRIWAGYTGLWGKQKSRDWDNGYKYDANGFNVGYDFLSTSGFNVGAAFGYSKGDYENRMALDSDSKIENYSFGLYGAYTHQSGFYVSGLATYTRSDYKMNNQFSSLIGNGQNGWDYAKYKGNSWSVGGELGYDFKPAENLSVIPTIGVYHYSVKTKDFNTSTRTGMKYSRTQTEMPIEMTVKYDMPVGEDSALSFAVNGGYAYNFTNKGTKVHEFLQADGTVAGGTRYVKPGRSGWNVGGGIQYRYKSFDVGANYEYYGRRGYTSHNVNANVGVSF